MSRFGFADKPVVLPELTSSVSRTPAIETMAEVAEAGRELGFVPREVKAPRTRRRKREKRSNMLIHGPERVLVRFRDYADKADVSYWEAIERLLDECEAR